MKTHVGTLVLMTAIAVLFGACVTTSSGRKSLDWNATVRAVEALAAAVVTQPQVIKEPTDVPAERRTLYYQDQVIKPYVITP